MKSKEVLALLVALGKTQEDIATSLRKLGIKGDRRKCRSCPIAQYLIKNNIHIEWAAVACAAGLVGIWIYSYPLCDYPQLRGISDFIFSFDAGRFSECEVQS